MLYSIIIFLLVLISILLIGIILLQSGQSGDLGTAMGGGAVSQAFGGEGADKLLVRITSGLAFLFMILAISIHFVSLPDSSDVDYTKTPIQAEETN